MSFLFLSMDCIGCRLHTRTTFPKCAFCAITCCYSANEIFLDFSSNSYYEALKDSFILSQAALLVSGDMKSDTEGQWSCKIILMKEDEENY
uniref:Secreted protein n=1 Tax=Heterorhabditis bacteriophora TaxID=37862 RepID=A0A1I7X528_HETBA